MIGPPRTFDSVIRELQQGLTNGTIALRNEGENSRQSDDELFYEINYDHLTGLPNRRLLASQMEQLLASAEVDESLAAVMYLDLDHFKLINDFYGHVVGDHCLRMVSERLRSRLGDSDSIARAGGDEFTILLGNLMAGAQAEAMAAELLTSFRDPFVLDGYNIEISASIGIAMYPQNGAESEVLLRAADIAMYRAKHSGRNRYAFVSDEIREISRR
jgi:diguanylate cyclase (GGDEF)-like protein